MSKLSATCGNLDFDANVFEMQDGCIYLKSPSLEGTYTLQLTVSTDEDGNVEKTYEWVSSN